MLHKLAEAPQKVEMLHPCSLGGCTCAMLLMRIGGTVLAGAQGGMGFTSMTDSLSADLCSELEFAASIENRFEPLSRPALAASQPRIQACTQEDAEQQGASG